MISILIGGKPLFIPKETVLVLEQHNYILDDEEPAGDIVWTFELPAESNAPLIGDERYIYVAGRRKYDCEVRYAGMPFSKGELYVQSSKDEKKLSCGIVANAFGVGFGNRMLCENDYGNDITISRSPDTHRSDWVSFLKSTLGNESIIKFMLFADEKFYKENEDYGYFNGKISSLMQDASEDLFCKYINRLFFDDQNNIIQNTTASRQGVRVFNEASLSKQNGYAFAPAIRLDWLMRQIMRNANLKLSGDWVSNKYVRRLFAQSFNALDGDVYQYGVQTMLELSGNLNRYSESIEGCQKYSYGGNTYTSFGWAGNVNFSFRALLPVGELLHTGEMVKSIPGGSNGNYGFRAKRTDEIYAFCVRTNNAARPSIRMYLGWSDGSGSKVFAYGRWPTNNELIERADVNSNGVIRDITITGNGNCRIWYEGTWGAWPVFSTHSFRFYSPTNSMLIQLTHSKSNNILYSAALGGYTEGNITPGWKPADWSSTDRLYIELVKCTIGSTNDVLAKTSIFMDNDIDAGDWGDIESITDYEVQESLELDTTDNALNIFGNILRWKDHVPDISNGEFIQKVCRLFGLNMYANPLSHEVQLSFFAGIDKARSFDISEFVFEKERLEYDPHEYSITIASTLKGNDVAEANIIHPARGKSELPSPMTNKMKHVYVENEKAYRRSSKEDDSSRFIWKQAGGDNRPLLAGSIGETKERVSIDVNIPNMTWVDSKKKEKYFCEAENEGCSSMFDENYDGRFDMVLMQYRGKRLIHLQNGGAQTTDAYIEEANPTRLNSEGDIAGDYLDMSAVGEKSIGEMWLKPLYDFKGNCERFRFSASLPGWAFVKMMSLLQPQTGNTPEQHRWIMVNNKRFLPIKISYELSYKDKVVTTIECAAPHFNL